MHHRGDYGHASASTQRRWRLSSLHTKTKKVVKRFPRRWCRARVRHLATPLTLSLLVVLVPLGCDRRSQDGDLPPTAVRNATSSWGTFYVTYQPRPDPIPLNELFSLEVAV